MITVIYYPKCSTCIKAVKWLREKNIEFNERHIVMENPTKEELVEILQKTGLPLKKLFNTSGKLYKEMNLKEELKTMSEEEQLTLLSQNGMLVKRPLVLGDDFALVGFKESEWSERF